MSKEVIFSGIKHYPCGDANLAVVNGKLEVTNLRNSGADGVIIDVKGLENWEMTLNPPLSSAPNKSLSLNVLGIDSMGRSEAVGGRCLHHNEPKGKWNLGINSRFCDDKITIVGFDGSNEVYNKSFPVPDNPETNLWILFLIYILEKSDFYAHDEAGVDNDYTHYSFNGSVNGQATDVEVFNGDQFRATRIVIETKRNVGDTPEAEKFKPAFLTYQGVNLQQLVISSETSN